MCSLELQVCLFELYLGLGLLRVQNQVSQHEKDNRCQIREARDVEPASRRMRFKMNIYAKQDKKKQEAAHANQQRRSSAFEHDYRAQCQYQIEIQCEVRLRHHPLHYCNEQTLEQEIEPEEPGLHTLRKPTPEQKAIECSEQEKDDGR
jgi:hypothetical protein